MVSREFLIGCFAVTCVYHFCLFLFYKKSLAALYFSLITFCSGFLLVTQGADWTYKNKIILVIFTLVPILFLEFTNALFPAEFSRKAYKTINRALETIDAVFIASVVIIPNALFMPLNPILQRVIMVVNVITIVYMVFQLVKAARVKGSDARIILLGYLILFGSALVIFSVPSKMENTNNPIGALGMLFLYSLTLARRYSDAHHACEKVVAQRTLQLRQEVAERAKANERLEEMSRHDYLTGLFNRKGFMDHLDQAIKRAKRGKAKTGVLFIDLNRFKFINDTYGHDQGDIVLKEVANRLPGCVRDCDIVSRLGGDEFGIILDSVESGISVREVCSRIVAEVERPITLKSCDGLISASIGTSVFPDNGDDAESLLKSADDAMYADKKRFT